MKLFLLALLPGAARADWSQVCYTGTIKIGNETWSEHDLMTALEPQVNEAIVTVANGDPKLAQFLKTQGDCQIDCLEIVMRPTFSTLYGKLGQDFYSHHKPHIQEIFIEALSGAFHACYPHPPREEVRMVSETIISHIGYTAASEHTFPQGVPCPHAGYEHDFPLNDFLYSFETTILHVMENKPKLHKFFDTEAKDCQKTCLQQTVPASAMTLFLHGNYDDYTGVDALTGAIQACFPDVEHEEILILVSETKDVMAQAEAEASRQYTAEAAEEARQPAKKKKKAAAGGDRRRRWARAEAERQKREQEALQGESFDILPYLGFVAMMSLAMIIGVSLGRRMERPGQGPKATELIPTIFGRKSQHSN